MVRILRKIFRWFIQFFLSGIFIFILTKSISKRNNLLNNSSLRQFDLSEHLINESIQKLELDFDLEIENKYSPPYVDFSRDSFIFMHIQVFIFFYLIFSC
jgi:hypothetical protein